MNILFCENLKQGNLGTGSVHIFEVVTNLRKLGHNVVLISEDGPRRGTEFNVNRQSLWRRMRDTILQSRILKPIRGEGIILWLFFRDIWSFIQAFIIVVRQKRRFDVIYRRAYLFNTEYFLAKLFRIPLVKEVNGIVVDEAEITEQAGKIALRIIDRIERFSKPKADKIIVVTPKMREVLQKDYGVPGDKIAGIPNGANTDLFKPMDATKARENLNLSQSNSYICFVGAFHSWAGIENIVKSAPLVLQKYPNTRFLLVGDGVMKQELINLAKQVGISDKTIFTGMVPYQRVPLYINASDICVCPGSKNFRNDRVGGGSPLKLPEYMACGKPVVVGSVVDLSKNVVDSGSGFAVDMRNSDELARVFVSLLSDEQLRKEMGEHGRRYVVENQSWESVAKRVADVCQSLIDSRRQGGGQ